MWAHESRWEHWPRRGEAKSGRPIAPPALLLAMVTLLRLAWRTVHREALQEGSYLVPVRFFIGIGWMRAFTEKAVDPGWRDGTSLSAFLLHQLQAPMAVVPPYHLLMNELFLPHAAPLGWIIMAGQVLAGVAILSGALTNAALVGGMFMNLNFLLAGVPDPSAFYIVLQMVLLLAGAGAIFGIDGRLGVRSAFSLLVARHGRTLSISPIAPGKALVLVALALSSAGYAMFHIKDWTPGGSVHDPAAVLAVLAFMTASWIAIAALRGAARHGHEGAAHPGGQVA